MIFNSVSFCYNFHYTLKSCRANKVNIVSEVIFSICCSSSNNCRNSHSSSSSSRKSCSRSSSAAAYVSPGVSFPCSNTEVRPSQLTEEQQAGGAGRGAGRRWTHCCLWPTPVKLLTLSPASSRNHQPWRKSSFPEELNDEIQSWRVNSSDFWSLLVRCWDFLNHSITFESADTQSATSS